MLKYIMFFGLVGCGPAELKTETSDTSDIIDERNWVTWDECGQNIGENPCNFVLLDHNGNEVELYDYYGKVIRGTCKSWKDRCRSRKRTLRGLIYLNY